MLNLHERALSLLSCRYVDEVIMGSSYRVSADAIKTMNVQKVVYGSVCDFQKNFDLRVYSNVLARRRAMWLFV